MTDIVYLTAIPSALIAVDSALCVRFMNPAAESLLSVSVPQALGRPLSELPAFKEELCSLCARALESGEAISLIERTLAIPFNRRTANMHFTPVAQGTADAGELLITIDKTDGLARMEASQWKHEATRAAGVMAAMLAHEVKNPLAGIRGAAQLLKDEVPPECAGLPDLICKETDRIRDLLAQVELFADGAPDVRQPVNIHEVLQYAIQVARTSFGRQVAFRERYDPSLPPVAGRRDLLVQLFLNIIKNAAEALQGRADAAITVATAYKTGYRITFHPPVGGRSGGGHERHGLSHTRPHPNPPPNGEGISLPIAVTITDNGPGIPENVRAHLFEPFVSSKEEGRGLGLAIAAKIASDLGAVIELDADYYQGARFTVWLAVSS